MHIQNEVLEYLSSVDSATNKEIQNRLIKKGYAASFDYTNTMLAKLCRNGEIDRVETGRYKIENME
jgi:predicted transcriptional regulator of viral defense system